MQLQKSNVADDLLNGFENHCGYGVLSPYWAWMSLE